MSSNGVAIVTGSAQGIGRGIALRLAADGYDISLNDIPSNRQNLDDTAKLIMDKGGKVLVVPGDVSNEEEVKQLVQRTVDELGGVDVMIANAGIGHYGLLTETSTEKWDQVFNVNVKGVMYCYKYAAIQMIKQGRGGRIIGACSIRGKQGTAYQSAYVASKFAVRGLTQSTALELGKYNITVNAYAPGAIDTPLLARADEAYASVTGAQKGSLIEVSKTRASVDRIGLPGDVTALVSFLVSKEASFITGQSVLVDGGIVFD